MTKISIGGPMLAAAMVLAGCANPGPAQPEAVSLPAGQIRAYVATGDVRVRDVAGKVAPMRRGDWIAPGSTLFTGEDGMVLLYFSNGVALQIKSNSELEVAAFQQAPFDDQSGTNAFNRLEADPSQSITTLNLINGTLAANVIPLDLKAGSVFAVKTPVGSALTTGAILQVQVALGADGNFSLMDAAVAQGVAEFNLKLNGLGTGLAPPRVRIKAGGQLKITSTGTGASAYAVIGAPFTGNEAATVINEIYTAMNEILSNLPPVPAPLPPTVPHLPEPIDAP